VGQEGATRLLEHACKVGGAPHDPPPPTEWSGMVLLHGAQASRSVLSCAGTLQVSSMVRPPIAFLLTILCSLCAACAERLVAAEPARVRIAGGGAPRRGVWVNYSTWLYGDRLERTGTSALASHSDGMIPQFRIRLPRREAGWEAQPLLPSSPAVERGASMLIGIARLDLPASERGPWFARYRDNEHWAWRYRRIREGVRYVAAEFDLRAGPSAAVSEVCGSIEIEPLPGATTERCRIAAIVDPVDGWPIAAEVSRSLGAPDGSYSRETATIDRLSPEQANGVAVTR
jgi:hypothetical protein